MNSRNGQKQGDRVNGTDQTRGGLRCRFELALADLTPTGRLNSPTALVMTAADGAQQMMGRRLTSVSPAA
jgi:hypothetical protein